MTLREWLDTPGHAIGEWTSHEGSLYSTRGSWAWLHEHTWTCDMPDFREYNLMIHAVLGDWDREFDRYRTYMDEPAEQVASGMSEIVARAIAFVGGLKESESPDFWIRKASARKKS